MTRKIEHLIKSKRSDNADSDNLTFRNKKELEAFASVDEFFVEVNGVKELVSSNTLRSYLHNSRECKTKSGRKYILSKYR